MQKKTRVAWRRLKISIELSLPLEEELNQRIASIMIVRSIQADRANTAPQLKFTFSSGGVLKCTKFSKKFRLWFLKVIPKKNH